MSAVPKNRPLHIFTIDVDGEPRKLFSVQERPLGDLTVVLRNFNNLANEGGYLAPADSNIRESRFSLHVSNESKTNINAFKMTTVVNGRPRIEKYNYTTAIKSGRYTTLYFERCRLMNDRRYLFKRGAAKQISLGMLDSRIFQLVYMVVVGPPQRPITLPVFTELNVVNAAFTYFTVSVLWRFMSHASNSTGDVFCLCTTPPEDIALLEDLGLRSVLTMAAAGYDAEEVISEYSMWSKHARDTFIQKTKNHLPALTARQIEVMQILTAFFTEPRTDTYAWQEHSWRCRLQITDGDFPTEDSKQQRDAEQGR